MENAPAMKIEQVLGLLPQPSQPSQVSEDLYSEVFEAASVSAEQLLWQGSGRSGPPQLPHPPHLSRLRDMGRHTGSGSDDVSGGVCGVVAAW